MPTFRMVCDTCDHVSVLLGGDMCNNCNSRSGFSYTYKNGKQVAKCKNCYSEDVSPIKLECPKCGSDELSKDVPNGNDSVARFVGERDWCRNLTDGQIADYLTPDDRGNFKDPY